MRYFTGLAGKLKNFILLTVGGHLLLTILVHMEGTKDYTELAEINPNGHIVDDSIKGWLTFAEVDCYLREISEY